MQLALALELGLLFQPFPGEGIVAEDLNGPHHGADLVGAVGPVQLARRVALGEALHVVGEGFQRAGDGPRRKPCRHGGEKRDREDDAADEHQATARLLGGRRDHRGQVLAEGILDGLHGVDPAGGDAEPFQRIHARAAVERGARRERPQPPDRLALRRLAEFGDPARLVGAAIAAGDGEIAVLDRRQFGEPLEPVAREAGGGEGAGACGAFEAGGLLGAQHAGIDDDGPRRRADAAMAGQRFHGGKEAIDEGGVTGEAASGAMDRASTAWRRAERSSIRASASRAVAAPSPISAMAEVTAPRRARVQDPPWTAVRRGPRRHCDSGDCATPCWSGRAPSGVRGRPRQTADPRRRPRPSGERRRPPASSPRQCRRRSRWQRAAERSRQRRCGARWTHCA